MIDILPYLKGFHRYRTLRGKPVIVGGCERSGTTLLLSILSAHPEVLAIPYETWGFASGKKAGFSGTGPIRIWRVWKGLGTAGRQQSQERWTEKTPANVFYFGEIIDHFEGRVCCLEIVRDGRDVVTSMHPDAEEPWVSVDRWIDAVSTGLQYSEDPRVHTVRYEDLVGSPSATIREVYDFAGLKVRRNEPEQRDEWLENWHDRATVQSSGNLIGETVGSIHSNSIHKWKRPDFPFRGRVEELLERPKGEALLQRYGYLSDG